MKKSGLLGNIGFVAGLGALFYFMFVDSGWHYDVDALMKKAMIAVIPELQLVLQPVKEVTIEHCHYKQVDTPDEDTVSFNCSDDLIITMQDE